MFYEKMMMKIKYYDQHWLHESINEKREKAGNITKKNRNQKTLRKIEIFFW